MILPALIAYSCICFVLIISKKQSNVNRYGEYEAKSAIQFFFLNE